ncbi:short chain dehydrogenase [Pseudobythopirellula maris]|uniref:Short chain dehydrogenase n=1 Tax=Pseudobythopirellula maris TaxID=2527991 RepID=A0A5C5ZXN6_9BACT|nr:class II aldolase/adducin family protein [Pseudobythopirellula maris]TWT91023.1 short chain dehydrogenase [Pseudobythopirellula maris]
MDAPAEVLAQLIDLSRWLGAPEQDCAILGEGNASALVDENTFLVKASGATLGALGEGDVVTIDLRAALDALDDPSIDDHNVGDRLADVQTAGKPLRPSVETWLHAVCLDLEGISFVGHTHPTAINALSCTTDFEGALAGRLFPDEIVVCGAEPLLAPYVDPGIVLARVMRDEIMAFVERVGEAPKTIYLRNHGFIALGPTASAVKQITAMAVKTARIRQGALAAGGIHLLTPAEVDKIAKRPDEHYRQRFLARQAAAQQGGA